MPLTLWRGEQLLGKLHEGPGSRDERSPRNRMPPNLSAILIPSSDSPELGGGVLQTHWPTGDLGVQQIQIEPYSVPQGSSGELHPVSPEHVSKAPPELQLTVRDEQGRVFLPRRILLNKAAYGSEQREIALAGAPREALINGRIWQASINFDSESETPVV